MGEPAETPNTEEASQATRKDEKRAPMIDYSRPELAEQAAASVVTKIVKEGARMLYEHYLERRSYPFAVDAAINAVVADTQMCFVPCEPAEDNMEEWCLEDEPPMMAKDNWARMVLPNPNAVRMRNTFGSSKESFAAKKKKTTSKRAPSGASAEKKENAEEKKAFWSLEEKPRLDAEEERFREKKVQYDIKKRQNEKSQKEAAKAAEQERIRIEALHEEMENKQHTFDLNGNVMWVEPPNLAKLPGVHQTVGHNVKSKNKASTVEMGQEATIGGKTKGDGQSPKPKRRKTIRKKGEAADDFPDGFIPLSYQQPPILETMKVCRGVSLEHKGKSKAGPPRDPIEGRLTRKEYVMLAQREISGNTQLQFTASGGVRAVGGNSGNGGRDGWKRPEDTLRTSEGSRSTFPSSGSCWELLALR